MSRYRIVVVRKSTSYDYLTDRTRGDSWEGNQNAKHNMEDEIALYKDDEIIFKSNCQTVANMPFCRHSDTLVEGTGYLRWDLADRRKFIGPIHGLVGFVDHDGQVIDENSVTPYIGKDGAPADWERCLCHSDLKILPGGDGVARTRFAWSAACIILPHPKHMDFYCVGQKEGFVSGQLIHTTITLLASV